MGLPASRSGEVDQAYSESDANSSLVQTLGIAEGSINRGLTLLPNIYDDGDSWPPNKAVVSVVVTSELYWR